MSRLQRYVLREFVPPFLMAIVVLAFVLLMDRLFLLADLLVRKGVPVRAVGEIALLSLPFVLSVCAPLGGLIAGVVAFGRMAQDNELAVVRSAGIPVWRVFVPAGVMCALLVPVMVGFNGYVVPEAQHRVRNLLTDVARKKPALRIRERVFMDDFPGYMVYIGTIDERRSKVANVMIFEKSGRQVTPAFVTAPRGEIHYTPDDRYMVLTLLDGEIHEAVGADNYRRLEFSRHVVNVPTDDELIRRDREYRSDQEMLMPALLAQVRQLGGEVSGLSREVKRLRGEERGAAEVADVRRREAETRLRYKVLERARFETEVQKRHSLAFSTLFFLLFGAPVGILLRRGGIGTGFVVGLVFFAVFYVLLLAGQNLSDAGRLPPFVGMWLPNLALVLPVVELSGRAFLEFSPLRWLLRGFRN
uniref:YjgP/YjgQ family permease n=1 Tax=candidate division WOR-3 bacterium TaxID=2052148 RepID=A0A7C4CBQ9_UNCW3